MALGQKKEEPGSTDDVEESLRFARQINDRHEREKNNNNNKPKTRYWLFFIFIAAIVVAAVIFPMNGLRDGSDRNPPTATPTPTRGEYSSSFHPQHLIKTRNVLPPRPEAAHLSTTLADLSKRYRHWEEVYHDDLVDVVASEALSGVVSGNKELRYAIPLLADMQGPFAEGLLMVRSTIHVSRGICNQLMMLSMNLTLKAYSAPKQRVEAVEKMDETLEYINTWVAAVVKMIKNPAIPRQEGISQRLKTLLAALTKYEAALAGEYAKRKTLMWRTLDVASSIIILGRKSTLTRIHQEHAQAVALSRELAALIQDVDECAALDMYGMALDEALVHDIKQEVPSKWGRSFNHGVFEAQFVVDDYMRILAELDQYTISLGNGPCSWKE